MTNAERKFKARIEFLLEWERYPSASQFGLRGFNGRQCKWREEVFEPWMAENPNHEITLLRRKLSV